MWNLVEPQLLRMGPVCGTSRNLVPGFGGLPQTTPKLYWKNPEPFRLLGNKTKAGLHSNNHPEKNKTNKPPSKQAKQTNYTSIDPKQPFSHSHTLDYFDFKTNSCQKYRGEDKVRHPSQPQLKLDPCTRNLEGNQRERSIQINELESKTKQDRVEGR